MNTLQTFFTSSKRSKRRLLLLLVAGLAVSLCAGVLCGAAHLDFAALLQGNLTSADARILLYVRLPRVCAGLLAGSALALSGVMIQAVLNNPLASPNVIGVNAGAGFFTFLLISLFPSAVQLLPIGAFFGALCATMLIYLIANRTGASRITLILAGIAVSSIFTAGINTIKTFFPDTLYNGSTFLIGGFSGVSFANLSPAYALMTAAILLSFLMAGQTDVLCLGEETAQGLGLSVRRTRFLLIVLACVLAGSAVSFGGLISFVGLIVPHIARTMLGTEHRYLLPGSCLLGAIFVVLCDLLSRVLFAPYEIPVGILLSLIGGPFFLYLVLRQRRRIA